MKTLNIYAIRDIKANEFNSPFVQPSHPHALRAFRSEVNRSASDNFIFLYPDEYELYHVGSFNTQTGVLNELQDEGPPFDPERLATGTDVKISK